jgi:hypothetical protein
MKVKSLLALVWLLLLSVYVSGQKITYAEPDREDNKRMNFEVIGQVGKNILVYKNYRYDHNLTVYNQEMKQVNKVKLDESSERWINVDFIPYNDYMWMIYQFQKRNVVYSMGVKLDENGKAISRPIELDTTRISWTADNKIYSTLYSDDKSRIMLLKINSKNPKNFIFTTMLYDKDLNLMARNEMPLALEERNDYFTDFQLDNDGGLVFGQYTRRGNDYITNLRLITKSTYAREFSILPVDLGGIYLDEIKVKVDNINNRYLFSAFYYKQRRGNIEGLHSIVYDKATASVVKQFSAFLDESLRAKVKGQDANVKMALNDFFIKHIIMRKDGGYILVAESMYTTSRGGTFNRWNYMGYNNPWMVPYGYYYSPFYNPWMYSPWNNRYGGQATRYHSENIMLISFDENSNIEWTNVIPKSQYDDESDAMISHFLMNTGGELHFLFNQYERRTLLLSDQSINAQGEITRYPTLKNLDRGYEFLPRYARQISQRSVVMPAFFRNYITFAKIEF